MKETRNKLKLPAVELRGIFSVEYTPPLVPPRGGIKGVSLANNVAELRQRSLSTFKTT